MATRAFCYSLLFFFFQAEDGIRDADVTGVQTCALPIYGVTPKRDLVGYRYQMHPNCDLREALNFFGTANSRQMKFNLDLACKAFGIATSKSEGVDGRSVESWYRAGRHREIADYCLEDVRATWELYEKIAPSILIF